MGHLKKMNIDIKEIIESHLDTAKSLLNDLDNIKRYCTHMVRKKFDQDIFMASLLNRLIELEANRVVTEMRKEKIKPKHPLKKFFRIH